MSFATKITDATFTSPRRGRIIKDRTKLVGEYFLGVDQASTIKNHANAAAPMTVQGSPIYGAHSVTVKSHATLGYGFRTGIVPNDDGTLICLRKRSNQATSVEVVCTPNPSRWGFHEFGGDLYGGNGEGSQNLGASRTIAGQFASVFFEAIVLSPQNPQLLTGGYGKLYHYDDGDGVQHEIVSAALRSTGRGPSMQLCIGTTSLTDSVAGSFQEVFYVAIVNRPLPPAEIGDVYTRAKAFYAALGVPIV